MPPSAGRACCRKPTPNSRPRERRVYLAQWPVLQVNSVLWRGIVVPPDQTADARRVGRLSRCSRATPRRLAGRRRSTFSAIAIVAGRQNLVVAYQRRLRRAGRGADRSRRRRRCQITALAPYGPWATDLGVVYAATGAVPDAGRRCAGAGTICSQRRPLLLLRGRRRAGGLALLRLCAAGPGAGGAGARGRALPRRRAHRPALQIARRPGDDRLRHERDLGAVLALLQPYSRVAF